MNEAGFGWLGETILALADCFLGEEATKEGGISLLTLLLVLLEG